MEYKIEEYKIEAWLQQLGLESPKTTTFLPENILEAESISDLIFTDEVIELEKYFKQNNQNIGILGGKPKLLRSRKNADIYLPAILFSISALSENPEIVTISLNIISSYLYDILKGTAGRKEVNIEFHLEKKGKSKKIVFKGTPEDFKSLEKIFKKLI